MPAICADCAEPYPAARRALGYRTCLECGDRQAHEVRWATVPLNKSNYVVVTNPTDLKQLNPKRAGD